MIGPGGNRSAVMEDALRHYLTEQERRQRDTRDREILEKDARKLAREAGDILGYQESE